MCSVFKETPSFHQQQAMTAVNVNRSLTTCSIINSFLKVIVWMRLVATLGSFVGDPSGGPPRDLLLVANNKKSHLVPDKNKMMILATQVAKPSLVLSLPTTTVSNCTAAVTAQKKKKIIGSFVEKINLEEYFEELVYATGISRRVAILSLGRRRRRRKRTHSFWFAHRFFQVLLTRTSWMMMMSS
jgi:hypothetical protein